MTVRLIRGDCVEAMRELEADSVDAIVTDPPYDLTNRVPDVKKCRDCGRVLGGRDGKPDACPKCGGELYNQRSQGKGFMGKDWDSTGVAFDLETWVEALRVLRPGGHLLAFGGSRTFHRLTCAIEDAGFEIRDSIGFLGILGWVHGQGFPKGKNVAKEFDKLAGIDVNARDWQPMTDLARQWNGWNVAIKPAWEPIILARKPLIGTIAANVAAYGTGAINVDACRIGHNEPEKRTTRSVGKFAGNTYAKDEYSVTMDGGTMASASSLGRWPANLILDEESARALDAEVGEARSAGQYPTSYSNTKGYGGNIGKVQGALYSDTGGPSRFFFVAHPDDNCWLCYGPKSGILSATSGSETDAQCDSNASTLDSANTAESNTNHRAEVAASALAHAPGQLPLKSEGSSQSDNKPAHSAGLSSTSGQGTSASIAQCDVWDSATKSLVRRVSDAGNLCTRCTTAIARALAAALRGDMTQILGPLSITKFASDTLTQNLAAFVEPWAKSATIPTTASLSILFGSVRLAISESTASAESDPSSPLRFRYQSKSSRAERNAGLEGMPEQEWRGNYGDGIQDNRPHTPPGYEYHASVKNTHPTVKPLSLMRWLVRLISPPNGTVFDPFTGSGSTGCACVLEGFSFIGIDSDSEYVEIARRRIEHAQGPMFAAVEVVG